MSKTLIAQVSILAATAAFLSACGGGGSTATAPEPAFALTVVQEQTTDQNSYVPSTEGTPPVVPANHDTALPGNLAVGGYSGGTNTAAWWGGTGTDSVYKGIGAPSGTQTDPAYVGVFVQGTGWAIDQASNLTVGLGTNAECVGVCKATIILKATPSCIATINSPITIQTAAVNTGTSATQVNGAVPTYSTSLNEASWTVSGCSTNTMAAFKALPLTEVHAQLLAANMQFTTMGGDTGLYANGINLGAVKFN